MADPFTIAAGQAVINYLDDKGCDCKQTLANLVFKFQQSYNREVSLGSIEGSQIDTDGRYGNDTFDALRGVMGTAPFSCYSRGNACFDKGIIADGAPNLVGVSEQPAPQPQPPLQPVSTSTKSETNWVPWIVGGFAVAAGGALIYMMQQRNVSGANQPRRS